MTFWHTYCNMSYFTSMQHLLSNTALSSFLTPFSFGITPPLTFVKEILNTTDEVFEEQSKVEHISSSDALYYFYVCVENGLKTPNFCGIREPPFDGLTAVRVGDCRLAFFSPLALCIATCKHRSPSKAAYTFQEQLKNCCCFFVLFFYILGKRLNFMAFPMKIFVWVHLYYPLK